MEKRSEISSAVEELSKLVRVKPGENHESALIPTKPFLSLCYLILQVLGGFSLTCLLFSFTSLIIICKKNWTIISHNLICLLLFLFFFLTLRHFNVEHWINGDVFYAFEEINEMKIIPIVKSIIYFSKSIIINIFISREKLRESFLVEDLCLYTCV